MGMKIIAITIGLFAALPAMAAQPAVTRQVSFSDLNLESDAGRAALQKRLMRAVNSICDTSPVGDSAAVRAEQQRCITETSAQLNRQMDVAVRANRSRNQHLAQN